MHALSANLRFHEAARRRAAQLVAEHGWRDGLMRAREFHRTAPCGRSRRFAYSVEVYVAEIAGVNPDNSSLKPLGPSHLFGRDIRLPDAVLRFADRLSGLLSLSPDEDADPPSLLTGRQIECLRWAAEGKSSWDIGRILGISPRTVDEHLENACRKLGVKRRSQAVITAHQCGLLDPPRRFTG